MNRRGALLLHGKWDVPDGAMRPLAQALADGGWLVRCPRCCWSPRRHYDVPFAAALAEVHGEIERLRANGCDFVLLAGHSLGANAALAAAAADAPADALALIAPGHRPESLHAAGLTTDALSAARAASPGHRLRLPDFNQGRRRLLRFRADVWLSFFDPVGDAAMARAARRLTTPRPMLWIDAARSGGSGDSADNAFDLLPPHPQNLRIMVDSSHAAAPAAAIGPVREWLHALEGPRWTT